MGEKPNEKPVDPPVAPVAAQTDGETKNEETRNGEVQNGESDIIKKLPHDDHDPSLSGLPTDLLFLVTKLLPLADQAALARTCKGLHKFINPLIYADNVKNGNSSCLFDGAKSGVVGTLENALKAGAQIGTYFIHPTAAAARLAAAADGEAGSGGRPPAAADDDEDSNEQDASADNSEQNPDHEVTYTPLHAAAKHNRADAARWLLDHGADPNAPSWKYCSCQYADVKHEVPSNTETAPSPFWRPLHTALCHKASNVAEVLIGRGSNVHSVSDETQRMVPAIAYAARSAMVSTVKLLALDTELDINEPDYEGNTALHYAALYWKPESTCDRTYFTRSPIPKLLTLGADIEATNEAGYTPLLYACYRGNFDAAMILLAAGAKWENDANRRWISTLDKSGHQATIDTSETARSESSPLFHCCLTRSGIAEHNGGRRPPLETGAFAASQVELLKMLIDRGADVDQKVKGMTPLMYASRVFQPLTLSIRLLLDAGAMVNARSDDGRTALNYLLSSWRPKPDAPVPSEPRWLDEAVVMLIKRGARLDLPDWSSSHPTALTTLTMPKYQRLQTLPLVCRTATSANISRSNLAELLELEAKKANSWCIYHLLVLADRVYGLPARVVRHLIDTHLEFMVKAGDVTSSESSDSGDETGSNHNSNTNDNTDEKPDAIFIDPKLPRTSFEALLWFRRSARNNDAIFLKTLQKRISNLCLRALQLGVAVPGVVLPNGSRTYLHLAAAWGDVSVVGALLERGAEVDAFDDFLQTPLAIAVSGGDEETADALMRELADPFLRPSEEVLRRAVLHKIEEDWEDEEEGEDLNNPRRSKRFTSELAAASAEALSTFLTPFEIAIRNGRIEILRLMLSRYCLPDIPPRTAHTYIHQALDTGNLEVLQLLLEKGAPADGGESCPSPPAVYIIRRMLAAPEPASVALRSFDAAKLLVKHGANVNLTDVRGRSVRSLLDGAVRHPPPGMAAARVRLAEMFHLVHDVMDEQDGEVLGPNSKAMADYNIKFDW